MIAAIDSTTILDLLCNQTALMISVNQVVDKVSILAMFFAGTFITGSILWNLAISSIKNSFTKPGILDKTEFARVLIIYFLLSVGYKPVFGSLVTIGSQLTTLELDELEEIAKDDKKKNTKPTVETPSMWDMMTEGIDAFFLVLITLPFKLLANFITLLVTLIALSVSKVLYALGPLVLAFSILPAYKDKFLKWLGVLLNCLCVPLTVTIIDAIHANLINTYALIASALPTGAGMTLGLTGVLIFNCIYVVLSCLSFWFTSFYVGSSGASKVLSTAVAAVTLMASAASGIPKSSGGGGGPVQDIISGASEATKGAN